MKELYDKLLVFLINEDKENAVKICMDSLENKDVSVADLYEKILGPSLNVIVDVYPDEEDLIWREHVRSGIIRSIIELSYTYVLKERNEWGNYNKGKVIVMCPDFEDHELGARMVADFFTIAGYETTFIGAKTPRKTLLKAIEIISPDYVSISVTNNFNLVSTRKIIEEIKRVSNKNIRILLGGRAFSSNPDIYKEIGGDYLLHSSQDIINLEKGVDWFEISSWYSKKIPEIK